jgi:hypothetical protein
MHFIGTSFLWFCHFLLASASPTLFALSLIDNSSSTVPQNSTFLPRGQAATSDAEDFPPRRQNAERGTHDRMLDLLYGQRPELVCAGPALPLKKLCKTTCYCRSDYKIFCEHFTDQQLDTHLALTDNMSSQMMDNINVVTHRLNQHTQQLVLDCQRLCRCEHDVHVTPKLGTSPEGTTIEVESDKTKTETNEHRKRSDRFPPGVSNDSPTLLSSSQNQQDPPSPMPLTSKLSVRSTLWTNYRNTLPPGYQPFIRPKQVIECSGPIKDDCEKQCYCDPLRLIRCDKYSVEALHYAVELISLAEGKRIVEELKKTRSKNCAEVCKCLENSGAGYWSDRLKPPYLRAGEKIYQNHRQYRRSLHIQDASPSPELLTTLSPRALLPRSGTESPVESPPSISPDQITASYSGAKLLEPLIRCAGMPGTNERCRGIMYQ